MITAGLAIDSTNGDKGGSESNCTQVVLNAYTAIIFTSLCQSLFIVGNPRLHFVVAIEVSPLLPSSLDSVSGIRSTWPQTISAPVNSDPNQLKNMCDFQPFLSPSLSLLICFPLVFPFLFALKKSRALREGKGCKEEYDSMRFREIIAGAICTAKVSLPNLKVLVLAILILSILFYKLIFPLWSYQAS